MQKQNTLFLQLNYRIAAEDEKPKLLLYVKSLIIVRK